MRSGNDVTRPGCERNRADVVKSMCMCSVAIAATSNYGKLWSRSDTLKWALFVASAELSTHVELCEDSIKLECPKSEATVNNMMQARLDVGAAKLELPSDCNEMDTPMCKRFDASRTNPTQVQDRDDENRSE